MVSAVVFGVDAEICDSSTEFESAFLICPSVSFATLRAAAMQLSSVTAVMSQQTRPYAGRQNQCVSDYWKTPSHTATFGSDTLEMHHKSHGISNA